MFYLPACILAGLSGFLFFGVHPFSSSWVCERGLQLIDRHALFQRIAWKCLWNVYERNRGLREALLQQISDPSVLIESLTVASIKVISSKCSIMGLMLIGTGTVTSYVMWLQEIISDKQKHFTSLLLLLCIRKSLISEMINEMIIAVESTEQSFFTAHLGHIFQFFPSSFSFTEALNLCIPMETTIPCGMQKSDGDKTAPKGRN